jgi:hypothetical protein
MAPTTPTPSPTSTTKITLYNTFIHTLPPPSAATDVVDAYLIRWYTGDNLGEAPSGNLVSGGGALDGQKLRTFTAAALESALKGYSFG